LVFIEVEVVVVVGVVEAATAGVMEDVEDVPEVEAVIDDDVEFDAPEKFADLTGGTK
jgi:hypothetical protein